MIADITKMFSYINGGSEAGTETKSRMTLWRFYLLSCLADGPRTLKDIRDSLPKSVGVKMAAFTGHVHGLEADGLIVNSRSLPKKQRGSVIPEGMDGRLAFLSLTEKGHRVLASIVPDPEMAVQTKSPEELDPYPDPYLDHPELNFEPEESH